MYRGTDISATSTSEIGPNKAADERAGFQPTESQINMRRAASGLAMMKGVLI